jgi:hypothetical protein
LVPTSELPFSFIDTCNRFDPVISIRSHELM